MDYTYHDEQAEPFDDIIRDIFYRNGSKIKGSSLKQKRIKPQQ